MIDNGINYFVWVLEWVFILWLNSNEGGVNILKL